MNEADFLRLLPEEEQVPLEELAHRQGVVWPSSVDDMAADVWESQEELEAFLRFVRESRDATLS